MNNEHAEILDIQSILKQIFPNVEEIPVNSISSSVYGEGEQKKIYLLILGNNSLIKPFLEDTKDEAKIKTVTSAERSKDKITYDVIMEFNFYFKRGKGTFKVIFQAAFPEMQKIYVQALKEIENLCFIIADEERNVRKVFEIDWYYYKNKKVIEKVVKANGYTI